MHQFCSLLLGERLNSGLINPPLAWFWMPPLCFDWILFDYLIIYLSFASQKRSHCTSFFCFLLGWYCLYSSPVLLSPCVQCTTVCLCFLHWPVCHVNAHMAWAWSSHGSTILSQNLNICVCLCLFWQEAESDDRLGLQGDAEGECDGDSKADTPDVPSSTADTDNTPQYLNKALEGLPPRYTLLKHQCSQEMDASRCCLFPKVHSAVLTASKFHRIHCVVWSCLSVVWQDKATKIY